MEKLATVVRPQQRGFPIPSVDERSVTGSGRRVVFRTRGHQHGPVARLVSPSDVGELIKPFVFLDRAEVPHTNRPLVGIHPHSGIATLTVVLGGGLAYEGINYFHVRLSNGQQWRYVPTVGHAVAWLAVDRGRLRLPETIHEGELAVFEESDKAVEVQAEGDASFVFGTAIKHPYPLVLGYYSVHTNADALAQGEAEIRRIGERLRARGRP